MSNLKFTNYDTNTEISIPLDKPITYIYGGNGTGKTTFSRQFSQKNANSRVFNLDFINRNVYVIDSDGAKMDPSTKENFSKLFISEQAVIYADEMVKVKEIRKLTDQLKSESIDSLNQILKDFHLETLTDLEKLELQLTVTNQNFDYRLNLVDNQKQLNYGDLLISGIKDNKELEIKIQQYKSNDIIKKIHESINHVPSLKAIFVDKTFIYDINKLINDFNLAVDYIISIEKDFNQTKNRQRFKKWIEEGLQLHEDQTTCLFCGSSNIEIASEKWKKLIQDKKSEIKNKLLSIINTTNKDINSFITNKTVYESLIPLIITNLERLQTKLKVLEDDISNNRIAQPIELTIEQDLIAAKIETTYNEIIAYILNENLIGYFFPFRYSSYLLKEQEQFEKLANEESDKFSKSTINVIDTVAKILGLDKKMMVFLETRKGAIPKMSIAPSDKKIKIGTFSEGQIHKLALAIFFAEILVKGKTYDYIVLDDPVISLDVVAYHKLKSFIIFTLKDKYLNLIILTHNISFLLIMLSNIIRDKDKRDGTMLLELKPRGYHQIAFESIAKDDIVLFKNAIDESQDIDDISLWYWMIEKIARHFMDVKLSLLGIVSFSDFSEDLLKIFTGDNLSEVKKIHNLIVRTSKSTSSTIGEITNALVNLNTFCGKLGFPNVVEEVAISRLRTSFTQDLKVVSNPSAKNFDFSILKEGHRIIFNTDKENAFLKDYIMHPRHQITESLVAFEAQLEM